MSYTPITRGQQDWDVPVNAAFTDQDTRITTNESGIATINTTLGTQGGRITALETLTGTLEFQPNDHALNAWTYDPAIATNASVLISGTVFMSKMIARNAFTANRLWFNVSTVATTPTAGQNFVGLYDSSGNRVAVSADISTDTTTSGLKSISFTSPVALSAGAYYGAVLTNAATPPQLTRASGQGANMVNANLTTGVARYTQGGTGWTSLTSLPASGTLGNRSLSGIPIWMALN